jgi:hypothetical protein
MLFCNLLDDNVGSLSVFNDVFESATVDIGCEFVRLAIRANRAIRSGFFGQTIC